MLNKKTRGDHTDLKYMQTALKGVSFSFFFIFSVYFAFFFCCIDKIALHPTWYKDLYSMSVSIFTTFFFFLNLSAGGTRKDYATLTYSRQYSLFYFTQREPQMKAGGPTTQTQAQKKRLLKLIPFQEGKEPLPDSTLHP